MPLQRTQLREALITAFTLEPRTLGMNSFMITQVLSTSKGAFTYLALVRLYTGMCNDVSFQFVRPTELFRAACNQQHKQIITTSVYRPLFS